MRHGHGCKYFPADMPQRCAVDIGHAEEGWLLAYLPKVHRKVRNMFALIKILKVVMFVSP